MAAGEIEDGVARFLELNVRTLLRGAPSNATEHYVQVPEEDIDMRRIRERSGLSHAEFAAPQQGSPMGVTTLQNK